MKEIWIKFYKSRAGQYIIYVTTFLIWMQLEGFEIAVIVCCGTILGEINFQNMKHK